MSTNPWDANFTPAAVDADLTKAVEGAVTQGVQTAENVAQQATQAVEGAVTGVLPPPPAVIFGPGGGGGGGSATGLTQTLENVISAVAKGSAEQALSTLAPVMKAELVKEFQAGTQRVVTRVTGGTDVASTPNLEDFIKADARSRAFRTLLIGLVVAVLTGLGTAAGQLVGADWSTHNGQVAALTVAIGTVVTSLGAYVSRLVNEPQVTKPLTAQLPSKADA